MSRSTLRAEDGMSIVEAMVAATILLVGIVSTFVVLDGSRQLTTVSERKEVAAHRAEVELERVSAIPFTELALAALPGPPTPGDTDDPRSWRTGNDLDWDRSSPSNALEPLVVDAASPSAITSRQTWSDGRYSGTVDTFVSTIAADLKRVTVAARLDGVQRPRRPIVVSTLVSRQAG